MWPILLSLQRYLVPYNISNILALYFRTPLCSLGPKVNIDVSLRAKSRLQIEFVENV